VLDGRFGQDQKGIVMKSLLIAAAVLAIYPVHATSQSNNLSRAYVSAVASAKGSTEFVEGRSSTVRDHGGAWMRITTDEIGYGRNAQARLLGSPLRELGSLPLCNVGGQPTPCYGRGTVIGYRRTWDASGREGGNFEYMVIPNGIGGPVRVDFQVR
jgi:hypothetical protein